jgi:hypothetical protein
LGDAEKADRAAVQALSINPALTEALLIRIKVATQQGDGETMLSRYRTLIEFNPGIVRWQLKLVQVLNWLGRVEEAVSEFESIRKRWPNDPVVAAVLRNYGPLLIETRGGDPDYSPEEQELQAIAEKAPALVGQLRPLLADDRERDVMVAEVPGAETAVLVFTAPGDGFYIPLLERFDRFLSTLDLTTVYLRDFNQLRYLLGIRSLGQDYKSTLAALRDMLNRLGAKRLCTIGNCAGAFAAIRYGVELGADRIIAFEPLSNSPRDSRTTIEEARNFMSSRLEASVPSDMTDLIPFLETRRHSAKIEVLYPDEEGFFRSQALRLGGLPGVRLHPQTGPSHALVGHLIRSNKDFGGMLRDLLGFEPAAARG